MSLKNGPSGALAGQDQNSIILNEILIIELTVWGSSWPGPDSIDFQFDSDSRTAVLEPVLAKLECSSLPGIFSLEAHHFRILGGPRVINMPTEFI